MSRPNAGGSEPPPPATSPSDPRKAPHQPRLAVLFPYWAFWEHTAPPGFRDARRALARRVARSLPGVRIVAIEEVSSAEAAEGVGERVAAATPDSVLVLQSMAVPPAWTMAVLDRVPGAAVVVWALHERGLAGGPIDHGTITTQGATVGAPMLTNLLVRRDRPFELLLGRLEPGDEGGEDTEQEVLGAIRAAAAAGSLRRARIGRVGSALEGYDHVDLDPEALRAATGIEVVPIPASQLLDHYRAVDGGRVVELESEVRRDWELLPGVDADRDGLARSLQAALALDDLVVEARLDAGALNCHVPEIRFGDEIGVTPCFGLGRLTSAGIPWTCTGDLLTAVAMLTAKRLGAAALYHELETVDYRTGEILIANSGEHDLGWLAPGERPRLGRNGWFCGRDARCGVCAVLEPAPGPATLVGFTPHPRASGGFRYVTAAGTLTARRFSETGTANGAFRFDSAEPRAAWRAWAMAGVNHHASASPGTLGPGVAAVARHLGVEVVEV